MTAGLKTLDRLRRGYESGLAAWVVGGNLGQTIDALRVPLTSIAYVNAARCQVPEDWSHLPKEVRALPKARCAKIKDKVLALCWADYPVTDLIAMLEPAFVIFANAPTFTRAAAASEMAACTSVCIHPWQGAAGTLLRPLEIGDAIFDRDTALQAWAPAVRSLLSDAQRQVARRMG